MGLGVTVKRLLVTTNLILVLLSLVVLVSYWSNSNVFGAISILGFLTPVLLFSHSLFLIFWLLKRSGWLLPSLLTCIVSIYSFGPFYKIFDSNVGEDPDISIMSYNAMNFNKWGNIPLENVDGKIREFIKRENPDILCLQEHSRIQHRELKLYAHRAETPYSIGRTVQAIFSKFPIINKGSLEPEGTRNNIIYADIVLPNDTIRVYNVHFQSFKIVPSKENLKKNEPFRLAKKISAAVDQQLNQVKMLRKHMKNSVYPTLVCGDFNSTQFSQIYRMASDGFQDSFFEKGNDWGSTYNLKGLPLRIDYILADHSFEVVSHQNYNIKLSDHYPVMAGFKLKPEK